MTIRSFIDNDAELALLVDPLEEVIDDLCDELKARHIIRVSRQECSLETGFVFNDILTDYERISDHCSNVAVDILDPEAEDIGAHEYHMNPDFRHNEFFTEHYENYRKEYRL